MRGNLDEGKWMRGNLDEGGIWMRGKWMRGRFG